MAQHELLSPDAVERLRAHAEARIAKRNRRLAGPSKRLKILGALGELLDHREEARASQASVRGALLLNRQR